MLQHHSHRGPRSSFASGFLPVGAMAGLFLVSICATEGAVGLLRTTENKTLKGEVTLEPGAVKITPAGKSAATVEFSRVQLLQVDPPERPREPAPGGSGRSPGGTGPSVGRAGLEMDLDVPASRGVLLSDGSFLTWGLRGVENNLLRFWNGAKEGGVPLSKVARIHYAELRTNSMSRVKQAQAGVLLHGGEFVEGEIKSLSERQVSVSSVLFGLGTYEVGSRVAAVVLRRPAPGRCLYVVKLRNGTSLRLDALECLKNAFLVREGILAGTKINVWELLEVRSASSKP
jgi:hypothetical protein